MKHSFTFGQTRVRDLRPVDLIDAVTGKCRVNLIEVKQEPLRPTKRFWTSFFTRFGIAENVFKYFGHEEVFRRIAERVPNDTIRYCIEADPQGRRSLLAVSNPDRPVAHPGELVELVERYGGQHLQYDAGMMTSFHVPLSGEGTIHVGPDQFKHRFVLKTPMDGYGNPRIFLALLRLVCSNGAVAYTPAFRSEIRTGKEVVYSIARALDAYDHGEGYAALRQRFESAQKSWASVNEANKLYRTLVRLQSAGDLDRQVLEDYHRMTGNLQEIYGLANLDSLSVKRQRVLPARCRVYDLLNFASELATHRARPAGSDTLQAHIGSVIADEYDMEGTAEKLTDFEDFFAGPPEGGAAFSLN